jgi:hypothetical protein
MQVNKKQTSRVCAIGTRSIFLLAFFLPVGGYYALPLYFRPLIGFLLSELFLYSGLLCLILLSLMRTHERLTSTQKQRETEYQLLLETKQLDRTSGEVPLAYRI